MSVLVTGAGSYVAQAIIRHLREKKIDVLATYRNHCPNDLNGARLLQLDICNQSEYRKLPRSIEAIVHIAAGTPRHKVSEIVQSAAYGLPLMQQYALNSNAGTFVLTSSISIHGRVESSIVDETTATLEPDIYGVSKLLVERSLAATADRLPVLALRLPSVLSRLETGAWIPSLMRRLLAHEDVTVFNPEEAFNNAIDIYELSRFVVSSIITPPKGFNAFPVASSGSMTINEIVEKLRKSVKSHSVISIHKTSRRSFTISSEYAMRHFGYEPINIHETLHRFIQRVAGIRR